MCKPFPPPLVRGGVFLVGSDTKYRDIADGNILTLDDIVEGVRKSDTKYRDIADGNKSNLLVAFAYKKVRYQVPRYSGFKTGLLMESDRFIELSSSVASITNAWCYTLCAPQQIQTRT